MLSRTILCIVACGAVYMDLFTDTAAILNIFDLRSIIRMPRGHEHISFVFSGAFRDIFS